MQMEIEKEKVNVQQAGSSMKSKTSSSSSSSSRSSWWWKQSSAGVICLFIQGLCGITAFALTLVWCLYYRGGLAFMRSSNKYHISNVHAVFSFAGFVFLASEAILAYKLMPLDHGGQKAVHVTFLGIAMIVGAPGIYAIFKFEKAIRVSRGLYSLHSWLGLTTIFFFIFQWMVGLYAFLYPRLPKKRRAIFLPRHKIAGLFIYGITIFAAVTGFAEKLILFEVRGLGEFSPEAMLVNAAALLTILFGMFVVLSILLPYRDYTQDGS